jgi:hypothetical protein
MSEKLVTPKVVPEGFTVTSVFAPALSKESFASSFTRYVPAFVKVAPVVCAFGEENETTPGPRTRDQSRFNTPLGNPSSETVPCKETGEPNTNVWGFGGTTAGALFGAEGSPTVMETVVWSSSPSSSVTVSTTVY